MEAGLLDAPPQRPAGVPFPGVNRQVMAAPKKAKGRIGEHKISLWLQNTMGIPEGQEVRRNIQVIKDIQEEDDVKGLILKRHSLGIGQNHCVQSPFPAEGDGLAVEVESEGGSTARQNSEVETRTAAGVEDPEAILRSFQRGQRPEDDLPSPGKPPMFGFQLKMLLIFFFLHLASAGPPGDVRNRRADAVDLLRSQGQS